MKQKDLEEIDDELLDEQAVDGEQCDNVSSEKGKRKGKGNSSRYSMYTSKYKKLLISKRRIGILKKLPKQGEDSESL